MESIKEEFVEELAMEDHYFPPLVSSTGEDQPQR